MKRIDWGKVVARRAVVWALGGLLAGGVAADLWSRQQRAAVERERDEAITREASAANRVEGLQTKLTKVEAEVADLRGQLDVERALRHRLEETVSAGRK
jgi:hypothetical protein